VINSNRWYPRRSGNFHIHRIRGETTVPTEKAPVEKTAAVKSAAVKTAMKAAAVKAAVMKASTPETSAVGLGSINADQGSKRDSNNSSSHSNLRVMRPSFVQSSSDFVHRTVGMYGAPDRPVPPITDSWPVGILCRVRESGAQ
jgi:hypothetical protein